MADAMKLVPMEPTEAMLVAADNAGGAFAGSDLTEHDIHRMIWSAMLAASPPAREEAPAEGAVEQLDRLFYGGGEYVRADEAVRQIMALQSENAALRNRTSEPEAREGEAVGIELTFGMGALVVNTGTFGGDNAVFIAKAVEPGEVGAYTGNAAFNRDVLQPGEHVLIFPTSAQAQTVADALVNSTHPAPSESDDKLRVAVEALEKIERWFGEFPETGRNWPNDDGSDSDRPMSYAAVNGSNGERDYMRSVARQALPALTEGGE